MSVYISDTHLYNRGQDLTGHTLRLAQGEAIRVILSELGVPKIFFEFLRIQERYIAPIMENEDPRAGYKVATQIPGIIVEHLVGRNASTLHLQAA
ncbi:hypothetical protein HY025_03830 [Candidatus Daviesbacteria bacterium]|nr:hypothetical protein [Candidatus Daviesbacteria bacterium]